MEHWHKINKQTTIIKVEKLLNLYSFKDFILTIHSMCNVTVEKSEIANKITKVYCHVSMKYETNSLFCIFQVWLLQISPEQIVKHERCW